MFNVLGSMLLGDGSEIIGNSGPLHGGGAL